MGLATSAVAPGDVQPVEHELRDRIVTGLVTALPVLALAVAGWQAWDGLLRPGDLVVFAVLYVLTGLNDSSPDLGAGISFSSRAQ